MLSSTIFPALAEAWGNTAGDVIHCLNPAAQDRSPLSQPARKGELCFYCERKFGQQAFLGEKCPTENFWVDESLESDSAKSESAESESARSLSVEIVESVRSWSVRGESAGGDEGVCVGLGVNGVSAGVQVWSSWKFSECGKGDIGRACAGSSASAEKGDIGRACAGSPASVEEAAIRPGCLKFSGGGNRDRHFATVCPQLYSKLP